MLRQLCFLSILPLLFLGCDDEIEEGRARADLDNRNWTAVAYARDLTATRIGINLVNSRRGGLREELGFQFILKDTGIYAVDFFSTDSLFISNYGVVDGDVIKDFYYLDATSPHNEIIITELTDEKIAGLFKLRLNYDTTRTRDSEDTPAVVTFTNGEFRARIE